VEKFLKPKVFIASSTESLDIAYAIQENIEYDSEPTVWTQGVFDLSEFILDQLLELLNDIDFGIFVFTPDDVVKIREKYQHTVRDNVLFELGLFVGKLGRERNFVVMPEGAAPIHLPTDLLGLVQGTYNPDRIDGDLVAATGPVCNKIRNKLKKIGRVTKPQNV
jgi:predicted nucleotide-binding protein